MALKWNRKSQGYDLERERPIRHVPYGKQSYSKVEPDNEDFRAFEGLMVGFFLGLVIWGIVFCFFFFAPKAHAQVITPMPAYSNEQIADAIYLAEGGDKTSHPYGILAKYKHTTPRQACINTIKHARRDWDGQGDFITFLGNRYCPVGAKNDPQGLNKNWIKNVKYFLNKGVSNARS